MRDVFTDRELVLENSLTVAGVLAEFPLAVLVGQVKG
jgi:hypothetical protein